MATPQEIYDTNIAMEKIRGSSVTRHLSNDPRWKDCGITGNCYWNEVRVNSKKMRSA